MKKLLLGRPRSRPSRSFRASPAHKVSQVSSAELATFNPTPGGANFGQILPNAGIGLTPVETNVIGAFGTGAGAAFGFGVSGSLGLAAGNTGSSTFTQGVGIGSNTQTLGTAAAQSVGLGGASGTGTSLGFGNGKGTGGADINTTLGVNNGIASQGGTTTLLTFRSRPPVLGAAIRVA